MCETHNLLVADRIRDVDAFLLIQGSFFFFMVFKSYERRRLFDLYIFENGKLENVQLTLFGFTWLCFLICLRILNCLCWVCACVVCICGLRRSCRWCWTETGAWSRSTCTEWCTTKCSRRDSTEWPSISRTTSEAHSHRSVHTRWGAYGTVLRLLLL